MGHNLGILPRRKKTKMAHYLTPRSPNIPATPVRERSNQYNRFNFHQGYINTEENFEENFRKPKRPTQSQRSHSHPSESSGSFNNRCPDSKRN
ncbi:hypothetical protein AVEN_171998-1 [Araneus ventricosus]|uniref:Uncharacterized protein n=1 Tax=Araneus ventricosus TaxID=182803 RepID=A0A4Y2PFN7_ARAVE|nr:hypothetical protein AVEN_171998-1 [Araneus ventricosus]